MPRCLHSLSLGTCIIIAGCFNPSGQSTDVTGATETGPGTTDSAGTTALPGTTATTDSTGLPTTTTNTTGPTTGPTATSDPTTDPPCRPPCSGGTPYCVDGQCISCTDLPLYGQNCDLDGVDTPYCDAASGQCVGCLIPDDCSGFDVCHDTLKQCVDCQYGVGCELLEVCDEASNTCVDCLNNNDCLPAAPICDASVCRRCEQHAECDVGACDLRDGTCFDLNKTRHLYVAKEGCGAMCGDGQPPCCQISDAIAEIAADDNHSQFIIHVEAGEYQPFSVQIPEKQIAVLAKPGATLVGTNALAPHIAVNDDLKTSRLYIAGLTVTGQGSIGLDCSSADYVGLDEVVFRDLTGLAAEVVTCKTVVRRSEFLRTAGGFKVGQDAHVQLENSIIAGLTGGSALYVTSNGQLDVLYTTIGLRAVLPGGLITCIGGAITIRNSALLFQTEGDYVDCQIGLVVEHSVTTQGDLTGVGVDHIAPKVFEPFVDWNSDQLRVKDVPSFLDAVALWAPSYPRTDIDNGQRPAGPDNRDVAGADLPGP